MLDARVACELLLSEELLELLPAGRLLLARLLVGEAGSTRDRRRLVDVENAGLV